eukprot:gene2900-6555_t
MSEKIPKASTSLRWCSRGSESFLTSIATQGMVFLFPFLWWDDGVVDSAAHRALAKEAADQSLVLLKNIGNTLPLDGGKVKKVAVIGRHANATKLMQGNYRGNAPIYVSPCAGIQAHAQVTTCMDGQQDPGGEFNASAEVDIAAAVKAVHGADAIVLTGALMPY